MKNIVIWGTGKEGLAAGAFVAAHMAPVHVVYVDETPSDDASVVTAPDAIEKAVLGASMVVKSPGVSLYHPLLMRARAQGMTITSLLNLWFAHKPAGKIICVTGTKGKSTTSALLGHVLAAMGHKVAVLANIGVPVTEAPTGMDYLVLELSSYQAADFEGAADIAAVTSLYPEHLNWHGTLEQYYHDKLRILTHAHTKIIHPQVRAAWPDVPADCHVCLPVAAEDVPNDYLRRAHNLANVGIVVAIVEALGLDMRKALAAMHDFNGLPHRQQALGAIGNIEYVDDSIATTPQAAMAAMDVYAGKAVTLIAGGYDRGIDYRPLVDYILAHNINAVVGLGPSGARILAGLEAAGYARASAAYTMDEAVVAARKATPAGGVILLSPAAPSFGLFKNYIERGQAFAKAAGF